MTVNLCLDQMALRLAAPGQLVGVSVLSHDRRLSVMAEAARAIPIVRTSVESILAERPDLVIFDEASHATVKRMLRQAGVAVLDMPWANSLDDLEPLLRRMAVALGREAAGEAVIADLTEQRRRLAWSGTPTARAAVLQANLGTSGKGSLMDDLLRRAGLRNVASDLGIGVFGRMSLETVLASRPDILVLDGDSNADPARATAFLEHRALQSLAGHARLVSLPIRYALCAGPENLEAVRRLAEARP